MGGKKVGTVGGREGFRTPRTVEYTGNSPVRQKEIISNFVTYVNWKWQYQAAVKNM